MTTDPIPQQTDPTEIDNPSRVDRVAGIIGGLVTRTHEAVVGLLQGGEKEPFQNKSIRKLESAREEAKGLNVDALGLMIEATQALAITNTNSHSIVLTEKRKYVKDQWTALFAGEVNPADTMERVTLPIEDKINLNVGGEVIRIHDVSLHIEKGKDGTSSTVYINKPVGLIMMPPEMRNDDLVYFGSALKVSIDESGALSLERESDGSSAYVEVDTPKGFSEGLGMVLECIAANMRDITGRPSADTFQ